MSFEKCNTVLVQFRLDPNLPTPLGVREICPESFAERAKREKRANMSPMKELLERNGASLAAVTSQLTRSSFTLDDATIQLRTKPADERKNEKPYRLLTYIFRRTPVSKNLLSQTKLYENLVCQRFEYVDVREGVDSDGKPLIVIVAKTVAGEAK